MLIDKVAKARCKAIAFAIVCLANYRGPGYLKTIKEGDMWKDDANHAIVMALFESHEITPAIREYIEELAKAGVHVE
jgi:hypothetical protein